MFVEYWQRSNAGKGKTKKRVKKRVSLNCAISPRVCRYTEGVARPAGNRANHE
jgi:hypothetical protein